MICTCTMNPSLDYFMEFDPPVKAEAYNRSRKEYYEAVSVACGVLLVDDVLNTNPIPPQEGE